MRYILHDGVLYRRSFTWPLHRCVSPKLTGRILQELHEGVCDGHPNTRTLADRVISQCYYWPTLRRDAQSYVKKCRSCQIFDNIPRLPSIEQTPVISAWPFDMWIIDLMGKFPRGKGDMEYLVVIVNYFSKWVEAKPLIHPS